MRVTIHQPEHFPYDGFFQKMKASDVFVVLDNVKFKKNNFQNRNKIKLRSGDESWITVPVESGANSKAINEVSTSLDPTWRKKLVRTIQENLGVDMTDIYSHQKLVDINMASIKWCMEKLGLERPIIMSSSLEVSGAKSELLVSILKSVGATTYVSGPSGKDYLDMSLFGDIEVEFFEPKVNNYYSSLYNILSADK